MRYFVLAAALLCAAPAAAEEVCAPLTILTSLDMKPGKSGRPYVPARIGGTQEYMLVDTGGFFSEMTAAAASALHLTPHQSRLQMLGMSGKKTNMSVSADFALGNLRADSADFMVPDGATSVESDLAGAGGMIAPNLLMGYDLDFDFAGKKLNLISQKHCDGKVVYWPADTVSVVPIVMSREFHIRVPVKLDGHDYMATLDTGASMTTLNESDATRDFALKLGDADTPAHGKFADHDDIIYTHRFHSLALEGIVVSNPEIELLPDLITNKLHRQSGDALFRQTRESSNEIETGLADVILGMDILHRLHLYVAYKEKKLYVTPAAASAAAKPTSARPPDPVAGH
jgi:predicted aspartyl protease